MARMESCALITALASLTAGGAGGAGPVDQFELDNGLTVILRPVDGSSLVAAVMLFNIGELHDPPGKSGLGHLVEHVYVTAAAGNRPAATAQAWMMRYDGQVNAQTGRDYTVVATVFPNDRVAAEIDEAAARMQELRLDPADLERETPRLALELANMYGGLPHLAAQNLAGLDAGPLAAGARKGGVMKHVEAMTVEEIRDRHRRYYKPINATLVLVGGFDQGDVRRQIEKRFGPVPTGEELPPAAVLPAASLGNIRAVKTPRPGFGAFPDAIATVAYRAPTPGTAGYPSFLILMSRLYEQAMPELQAAMRQRSVVVPVTYAPFDMPELVFVSAAVADGHDDEQAVNALRRRVADVIAVDGPGPPSRTFLTRQFGPMLGTSEIPEAMIGMNPYFLAFCLGRREQLGLDPDALNAQLENITIRDLQRCAAEVFADDRGAAVVVRLE